MTTALSAKRTSVGGRRAKGERNTALKQPRPLKRPSARKDSQPEGRTGDTPAAKVLWASARQSRPSHWELPVLPPRASEPLHDAARRTAGASAPRLSGCLFKFIRCISSRSPSMDWTIDVQETCRPSCPVASLIMICSRMDVFSEAVFAAAAIDVTSTRTAWSCSAPTFSTCSKLSVRGSL